MACRYFSGNLRSIRINNDASGLKIIFKVQIINLKVFRDYSLMDNPILLFDDPTFYINSLPYPGPPQVPEYQPLFPSGLSAQKNGSYVDTSF